MPKWNEAEALGLVTPNEWEHLARLAHQMAWERAGLLEQALDDDEGLDYSGAEIAREARAALTASARGAPHQDRPIVQAVFAHKFRLGWKCWEARGHASTGPEYPGMDRCRKERPMYTLDWTPRVPTDWSDPAWRGKEYAQVRQLAEQAGWYAYAGLGWSQNAIRQKTLAFLRAAPLLVAFRQDALVAGLVITGLLKGWRSREAAEGRQP